MFSTYVATHWKEKDVLAATLHICTVVSSSLTLHLLNRRLHWKMPTSTPFSIWIQSMLQNFKSTLFPHTPCTLKSTSFIVHSVIQGNLGFARNRCPYRLSSHFHNERKALLEMWYLFQWLLRTSLHTMKKKRHRKANKMLVDFRDTKMLPQCVCLYHKVKLSVETVITYCDKWRCKMVADEGWFRSVDRKSVV